MPTHGSCMDSGKELHDNARRIVGRRNIRAPAFSRTRCSLRPGLIIRAAMQRNGRPLLLRRVSLCHRHRSYFICYRSERKDNGDSDILRNHVELLGKALGCATGSRTLKSMYICSCPLGCCSRHSTNRSGGNSVRTSFVRWTFA